MQAARAANDEPIPGYRLVGPLGRGGYGEVWKCIAPGGLAKAIKFVAGGDALESGPSGADQELRALEHIKSVRHPFLLSIERVEAIAGELAIVMELAERSLHDVLTDRRASGHPGIPRDELLAYLYDAAEALDVLSQEHGLQHLDVKPRNLFLVGRHVKVADFGLVNSLAEGNGSNPAAVSLGAITPVYAAPESFLGQITLFCDQYSLAVTYCELLTGVLPFAGKNFRQLALQHAQSEPDLSRLPPADRPAVARALAKEPCQRFASCSEFVRALEHSAAEPPSRQPSEPMRRPRESTRCNLRPATSSPTPAQTARAPSADAPRADVGAAANAALTGYQFLECLARLPTGEVWRAQAPGGRRCIVRFLFGCKAVEAEYEGDALAQLRSLHHAALAPIAVERSGPHRVALIRDEYDGTLADRYKECQNKDRAGIPRAELLDYLRQAAAALDELYQARQLRHLALQPRTLLLNDSHVLLGDFGLAELIWLPAGLDVAAMNARYAALELFEHQSSPNSDQYSLALIFQELLTGAHPFRNTTPRHLASSRRRGRPDFSLLPAPDRAVVARALAPDPHQRFTSCTEFVAALEMPAAPTVARSTAVLRVTTPAPTVVSPIVAAALPSHEIVQQLVEAAAGGASVVQSHGLRYCRGPGDRIAFQRGAHVAPGTFELKLDGFQRHWGGTARTTDKGLVTFRVAAPVGGLERWFATPPALEVEIAWGQAPFAAESLVPIRVDVRALDDAVQLLKELGPEILASLQGFCQLPPERRLHERFAFTQSLRVLPMHDGQVVGETLLALGRDLSPSGMSFQLPCRPPSSELVLVTAHPTAGRSCGLAGGL